VTPLRRKMIQDMRIKNLSPETQKRYVGRVAAFALHFGKCPSKLGPEEVRQYQIHLIQRGVSPSHLNVTVSALKFLYSMTLGCQWKVERIPYARRESKLPVIPSKEELLRFFSSVESPKYRALFMTIFAAGLRVSEVTRLRVSDIDSSLMLIRVHQGKGRTDRYVMLSEKLLPVLRSYWQAYRPKLWLFPSSRGNSPVSTGTVRRICHEAYLRSGLKKKITPHTLRHAFGTYLLQQGTALPVIQLLLGHKSPSCTVRYTRIGAPQLSRTKSPFDSLPL